MTGPGDYATVPRVGADGYLSDFTEWDAGLALQLGKAIGVELTARHWDVIRFLRQEYYHTNRIPQLHRVSVSTGIPVRELFELFPGKPAKKMAYIAGLPKPHGSV